MKDKSFLWIGIFLVLFTSIYATPPVLSTIQTGQLDIQPALFDSYKVNTFIELDFHIYNTTGNLITNETALTTICNIHIYNANGSQFINTNLPFNKNEGDWEFNLSPVNTSRIGVYNYLVSCNGSQSGWINSQFYVTEHAINLPVDKYPNYDLILVFGLMAMAFFFIYFSDKFKIEGTNVSKSITGLLINLLFKLSAFAIIIFEMFIIRNLLPSFSTLTGIYDALLSIFVYGVGLIFFLLYFINSIVTLIDNFQIYKANKKIKEEKY